MSKPISRLRVLYIIFRHPTYLISTAISSAVFYYIFYTLITMSNEGAYLLLIPTFLVYLLMAMSGMMFSISLYIMARSLLTRSSRLQGGVAGVLLPSVGGLIASCGCSFSVLASILIFLGINTFDAVGLVSAISAYQLPLMVFLIAMDAAMIYYYTGKLKGFFRKLK